MHYLADDKKKTSFLVDKVVDNEIGDKYGLV